MSDHTAMPKSMKIPHKLYMDVCCLNRAFDDWSQPRVRIEAEAILELLANCQPEQDSLISSSALEAEIDQTPDPLRRKRVRASLDIAQSRVVVNAAIVARAQEIATLGCKSFDALHIACAEFGQADVFLTTDDRLLRKAQANPSFLQVRVANPVTWLIEISESSGDV